MAFDYSEIYTRQCGTCEKAIAYCKCPNLGQQLIIFREKCQELLIENVELRARLETYEPILDPEYDVLGGGG